MTDPVVLTEFRSEVEASLAAATLKANGIHADTRPAGRGFHTSLSGTTAILVDQADVARARQLLSTSS